MSGTIRGARRPGQRLGVGGLAKLVFVATFATMLLAAGIARWHDRSIIMGRGTVVTAQVVAVHSGGHGRSVDVRFTTASGEEIVATVQDPPVGPRLEPGAPLQVRYDPQDPSGRVLPTNENQSVISMWFLIGGGVVLLVLAGYVTVWWARESRRH